MGWQSSKYVTNNMNIIDIGWENSGNLVHVNQNLTSYFYQGVLPSVYWVSNPENTFRSNKVYQYKTIINVTGLLSDYLNGTTFSFKVKPIPNTDEIQKVFFSPIFATPSNIGLISLSYYNKPNLTYKTNKIISYYGNKSFNSSLGINKFNCSELDWLPNGYKLAEGIHNTNTNLNQHTNGWDVVDQNTFIWRYQEEKNPNRKMSNPITYDYKYMDVFGINKDDNELKYGASSSPGSSGYLTDIYTPKFQYYDDKEAIYFDNWMGKYVDTAFFNIKFGYSNPTDLEVNMYLSDSLPIRGATPSNATLVTKIKTTIDSNQNVYATSSLFFNLPGNQYVYFKVDTSNMNFNNNHQIIISNVIIDGGYNTTFNNKYLQPIANNYKFNLPYVTFSTVIGSGNSNDGNLDLMSINSKAGNGFFKAGIWENGVWNSGYRKDETVYEFFNITQYSTYNKDRSVRFIISGPSASVSKFEIGDKVAISNIVVIDLNNERKFLKNYYRIVDKTYDVDNYINTITLDFTVNYPIRQISIDSTNHRILITKNVWLYGLLLNGYFSGVWNDGKFKGFPLITEMYDTHWIDGKFDGGHISSYNKGGGKNTISVDFIDHKENVILSDGTIQQAKLKLLFKTPHGLNVGDSIRVVSSLYNKDTTILSITQSTSVVTNLDYVYQNPGNITSGNIITNINTSLLQNVDMNMNNISKSTTKETNISGRIFIYNSWVDLVYDSTSAVNIGKPQSIYDDLTNLPYSQNNLYGYPTNDILSSESYFRDCYSLTFKTYKLGVKPKIFNDFIGDSGLFEEYFKPTNIDSPTYISDGFKGNGTTVQLDDFNTLGWKLTFATFSNNKPSVIMSRTIPKKTYLNDLGVYADLFPLYDVHNGKELQIWATASGGVLNLQEPNFVDIPNRSKEILDKNRYTVVEFDLVTYSVATYSSNNKIYNKYTYDVELGVSNPVTYSIPFIQQNNIIATSSLFTAPLIHFNNINEGQYLPIKDNVNHLLTPNLTKKEYFYNKRNLSMYFRGTTYSHSLFIMDNVKFYEVDMVPFFKYYIDENVNKTIQIPYVAKSPNIYNITNINYNDNIKISLDDIKITNILDKTSSSYNATIPNLNTIISNYNISVVFNPDVFNTSNSTAPVDDENNNNDQYGDNFKDN